MSNSSLSEGMGIAKMHVSGIDKFTVILLRIGFLIRIGIFFTLIT